MTKDSEPNVISEEKCMPEVQLLPRNTHSSQSVRTDPLSPTGAHSASHRYLRPVEQSVVSGSTEAPDETLHSHQIDTASVCVLDAILSDPD
jgi:hypothetical protein